MLKWFRKRAWKQKREIEIPDDWPRFSGGLVVLKRWTRPDRKFRVYLLVRPDRLYTVCTSYFSEDPYELCWVHVERGSLYDSVETAVREIVSNYIWTKDVESEEPAPRD